MYESPIVIDVYKDIMQLLKNSRRKKVSTRTPLSQTICPRRFPKGTQKHSFLGLSICIYGYIYQTLIIKY